MISREPLLVEAIKGGMDAGNHEIYARLRHGHWKKQRMIHLTHDENGRKFQSLRDGLEKHREIISDPDANAQLWLRVVKKHKPGEDPAARFRRQHDMRFGGTSRLGEPRREHRVATLDVQHTDTYKKSGSPIVIPSYITTEPEHRRKGWASTIFDHTHRSLKRLGLHLQHDEPGGQLAMGKRWAARQETARGQGYVPPHRKSQLHGLTSLAIVGAMQKHFPHLGQHHGQLSTLANRVLDQGGGYYGPREVKAFSRAARKLGVARSALTPEAVRHILSIHKGTDEHVDDEDDW